MTWLIRDFASNFSRRHLAFCECVQCACTFSSPVHRPNCHFYLLAQLVYHFFSPTLSYVALSGPLSYFVFFFLSSECVFTCLSQGFLMKRRETGNWQKRWCVLTERDMEYYHSRNVSRCFRTMVQYKAVFVQYKVSFVPLPLKHTTMIVYLFTVP